MGHRKIEHRQWTFGRDRLGCLKRRDRQFEIILHVVEHPEKELRLFGGWIGGNGLDETALRNIRTMRKGGQPGLEHKGWNHVWALMNGCTDFVISLCKFPLGKIPSGILVMLLWTCCDLRRADRKLEREKPDHRSLPPGASE